MAVDELNVNIYLFNDKNISPLLEIGSMIIISNNHLDFIELGTLLHKNPLKVPDGGNSLGNADFMLKYFIKSHR